jgi:hypothetical protein
MSNVLALASPLLKVKTLLLLLVADVTVTATSLALLPLALLPLALLMLTLPPPLAVPTTKAISNLQIVCK